MADAIGSHLRDLESEARDAEKEVEDYRTRTQRRMDIMNAELKQLIAKYQSEKAIIQEHIQRKQLYAQRKQEEYENFRDILLNDPSNRISTHTPRFQTSTSHSEPPLPETTNTRNSLPAADEFITTSEPLDLPKPSTKPPVTSDPSAFVIVQQKYLPETPIIVRAPTGKWLEIRCMLCGGNWIDKKGWIRGGRGMLAHANKSHKMDIYKGRKLDSVTILEYCTHRELTDDEVQAVVDGSLKPEVVPVRDIGNVSQNSTPKIAKDFSTAVQSTTPKPAKILAPGLPPLPVTADDDDRPYDWLQRFPTIVLRRDGQWVELRCDICGGNSLANSDKRYATGVVGFVRHLSRGHSAKPDFLGSRIEWALQRCEYRMVPEDEIRALTENSPTASGPPKIPFQQSGGRYSTGSALKLTPGSTGKRRPKKRPSETNFGVSDDDNDDFDMDGDDSDVDFNPEGDKKRRYSISNSITKQTHRPAKKLAKESVHSPSPMSATPEVSVPVSDSLDMYCPCSIAGHTCAYENCDKIRICTMSNHDEDCNDNPATHKLKPTCVMALLSEDCPDGELCNRGHDYLEQRKRIAALHNCETH